MTAIKKAELLAGCVCAGLARRSLFFPVLIDDGAEKKNLDLGEGGGVKHARVCAARRKQPMHNYLS